MTDKDLNTAVPPPSASSDQKIYQNKDLTSNDEQQPSTNTSFSIVPKDIMAIPKRTRPNIKRGKTVEITSSPYHEEFEAQETKEIAKKVKQNLFTGNKGIGKQTNTQKEKGKKSTKKNSKKKSKDSSSEDEEDVRCFYCSHLFSESTEDWVQCPACSLWAHCSCAGVEDNDEDVRFVCKRYAVE
nr:PHD finger protein 23A-like [Leptinotarsa decemlineata]